MRIAVIGGGAAGYFAAINIMEMNADSKVVIFEAAGRSLAKVAVSGGGRCNITNTFAEVDRLQSLYPRGTNLIKRAFKQFDHRACVEWFESRGVRLTAQDDECIFPLSQSADEVVDLLTSLAKKLNIEVRHLHRVRSVRALSEGYEVSFGDEGLPSQSFEAVVVTTGGQPKESGFDMLSELEVDIEPPVPSLFSFNIPNNPITQLMGAVAPHAIVTLGSSKLSASGALLITHWGMSGPAILRLSSYGARLLAERGYESRISVNWVGERDGERVMRVLRRMVEEHGGKLVTNVRPYDIPTRIWMAVLIKSGVAHDRRFVELGSKGLNRLVDRLTNDEYIVSGQTKFRDEFVTCGGVSIASIDMSNCESRRHANLYFAGEVLDVDAVTGGFNLQAAWSTAYVVAKSLSQKSEANFTKR